MVVDQVDCRSRRAGRADNPHDRTPVNLLAALPDRRVPARRPWTPTCALRSTRAVLAALPGGPTHGPSRASCQADRRRRGGSLRPLAGRRRTDRFRRTRPEDQRGVTHRRGNHRRPDASPPKALTARAVECGGKVRPVHHSWVTKALWPRAYVAGMTPFGKTRHKHRSPRNGLRCRASGGHGLHH